MAADDSAARPRIYVSYSTRDGRRALTKLRSALEEAGFEPVGDWTLKPGDAWANVLDELLRTADGAVVQVTRAALQSEPIAAEALALHQRMSTEPGFRLVPLLAEDVTLDDLAASPLAPLADALIPLAPGRDARIAETVVGLAPLREPEGTKAEAPQPPTRTATPSEPPRPTSMLVHWGAPITALTAAVLDGRLVVVAADEKGSIGVWEPRSDRGQAIKPLIEEAGSVLAVGVAELEGLAVAIAGADDGTVWVVDLDGRLPVRTHRTNQPVLAYAVAELEGRPVAIAASRDGTVQVVDLGSGQPVRPPTTHISEVVALAVGALDGRPVLVTVAKGGLLEVLDLAGAQQIGVGAGLPRSGLDMAIAVAEMDGRLVVVYGDEGGVARVDDLANGKSVSARSLGTQRSVRALAVAELAGRAVVVTGSDDGVLRVVDLDSGEPVADPFTGHAGPVRAVDVAELDGRPLAVTGGRDGTVRVRELGAPSAEEFRDQVEWRSDAPAAIDLLRRRPLARALAERLQRMHDEEPTTSFLIHLDGPWGSGKSTLLNFMRTELPPGWLTVDFDAWRQAGLGPPWWALLAALRHDLGRNLGPVARARLRMAEAAARLRRTGAPFVLALAVLLAVASAVFLLLRPPTLDSKTAGDLARTVTAVLTALGTLWAGSLVAGRFLLWDSARGARLFEQSNTNPMQDVADHFGWLLAKVGRPVLFLIDDLDRCSESYVVELLDAVQTLVRDAPKGQRGRGGTAGVAYFVIAADGAWIRRSYEIAYDKFAPSVAEPGRPLGYLFLDKLFQLRVPVPAVDAPRQEEYLRGLLGTGPQEPATAYDPAEEERAVRAGLQRSTTEAQVVQTLQAASPEIRDRVASSAVARLTAPEVAAATEHSLQRFGALLQPNPRSMKRFVNAYSVLRAVRTLEGNPVESGPLALWTILETRWPSLADHLRANPESIELLGKPASELSQIPRDLRVLFGDAALRRLTDFEHGGPLTPDRIRECAGIPRPSQADPGAGPASSADQ